MTVTYLVFEMGTILAKNFRTFKKPFLINTETNVKNVLTVYNGGFPGLQGGCGLEVAPLLLA